jgi:hypothetical protein
LPPEGQISAAVDTMRAGPQLGLLKTRCAARGAGKGINHRG